MTCRSLLAAAAAMTTLVYPPVPAAAADQIEIVLTEATSARGLGGNDVCRIHLKIKNRTAFRLENLTFALNFPGLATPALGGTGLPFLSPASLGSDREDDFVATWHNGSCQAAHYQLPTLASDTCVVGTLPERQCKALFTLRSEIKKTGAIIGPSDFNAGGPALTDQNMQGVSCSKLLDVNSKLLVSIREVWIGLNETRPSRTVDREIEIDRATGTYSTDLKSSPLDIEVRNGFYTQMNYRWLKPEFKLHKFARSIDVFDAKYNLPGEYTYRLTKNDQVTAMVSRRVKDLGPQTAGSCSLRAIFVEEQTQDATRRVREESAYVWYPDLKLRIDRFAKGQFPENGGARPIDPRVWNRAVARIDVTSLKIAE